LQKEAKNLQFYRFVSSAIRKKFLRLPEFDFCPYRAKITRNHGALKRYTDFYGLQGALKARTSRYISAQITLRGHLERSRNPKGARLRADLAAV